MKLGRSNTGDVFIWCPGCGHAHRFDKRWTLSGTEERPTLRASHLQNGSNGRCHLFVTEGRIEYCNDCEHELRGKVIDLPDWPYSKEA